MIMPSTFSSLRFFSQTSANFFQSVKDIFSDHFIKGFSIFVMLQISFIPGAIFRISSASVEITAPDFGSSREEIVPPVIIMTTFGKDLFCSNWMSFFSRGFPFSKIDAFRISFSLIPML